MPHEAHCAHCRTRSLFHEREGRLFCSKCGLTAKGAGMLIATTPVPVPPGTSTGGREPPPLPIDPDDRGANRRADPDAGGDAVQGAKAKVGPVAWTVAWALAMCLTMAVFTTYDSPGRSAEAVATRMAAKVFILLIGYGLIFGGTWLATKLLAALRRKLEREAREARGQDSASGGAATRTSAPAERLRELQEEYRRHQGRELPPPTDDVRRMMDRMTNRTAPSTASATRSDTDWATQAQLVINACFQSAMISPPREWNAARARWEARQVLGGYLDPSRSAQIEEIAVEAVLLGYRAATPLDLDVIVGSKPNDSWKSEIEALLARAFTVVVGRPPCPGDSVFSYGRPPAERESMRGAADANEAWAERMMRDTEPRRPDGFPPSS